MLDPHRIEIPTPFHVGRVNCYAFPGDELVVIDPGPRTDEAYAALETGLEEMGQDVADVERVLITHPHMDHFGLAARVRRESGAAVVAHEDAVAPLADPDGHLAREQAFFRPFLRTMGVPEELVDTVVDLPGPYAEFREPVEVDRPLQDGDVVDVEGVVEVEGSGDVGGVGDGGRLELEAVHTPGHAPGSVCFVAATEDVAFTGDHVMLEVSPNPLLTLEPGNDDERTRSLPAYIESLDRIREVGASVGHAGHRGRIDDLPGRATEIADHHHERKERIAGLVGDAGSDGGTTAYGIMKELFPDLPVTEMFPGMSEVIGHLDLLEDEGRVETVEAAVDGAVVDEAAVDGTAVDEAVVDAVRRYRLV